MRSMEVEVHNAWCKIWTLGEHDSLGVSPALVGPLQAKTLGLYSIHIIRSSLSPRVWLASINLVLDVVPLPNDSSQSRFAAGLTAPQCALAVRNLQPFLA